MDIHQAKLEKVRRLQEESLRFYKPNPVQLRFHKSRAGTRGLFAANQCLLGDTMVLLPNGSSCRIDELSVGDTVLGYDNGILVPSTVRAVYSNGLKDVYEYRFGKRNTDVFVRCTDDHKVLYEKECHRDKETKLEGISSVTSGRNSILRPTGSDYGVDNKYALLLGLLLGDGCLCVEGIQFTCADDTLIDDIRDYASSLGVEICQLKNPIQYKFKSKLVGRKSALRVWLESLGLKGTNSHTKFIPKEVWGWSTKSIESFVAGLIATDGSIYVDKWGQPSVAYTSVSYELISELKKLLEVRLGIYGSTILGDGGKHGFNLSYSNYEALGKFSDIKIPGVKNGLADRYKKLLKKKSCGSKLLFRSRDYLGELPTYDIMIDNDSHLFAIEGGVIVSNSGKSWASNNELAWTIGKVHPYRPNKSGPVFGRICYQDIGVIESVAIPTFKRILPRKECLLEGKTFEGKERRWPGLRGGSFDKAYDKQFHVLWLDDGSFTEFKTYQQDLQSYAGPPRDIIAHDEEPPEKIYQENLARQVTRGVNILFAMTPLNYSQWLYSDIYMKASTSKDIDVFTMSAYDNPTADVKALKELEASITDPAIRAARMYGKFTYLEGLVWKEYGDHNFIEPFQISEKWHKSIVIDPHPAKDTAVNWFAEDLDGKIYCYREASLKGSVDEVCSEIKGLCGGEGIDDIYIDPAAKGQKTNWGGDSILFKFQESFPRIMLANNNVTGGIDKVRDMAKNKIGSGPKLFVFKNCPNTDWQMRNFSWKAPTKTGEDRAKPQVIKRNDDHCDNVRYRCMASFSHRDEESFKGFGIRGYAS